MDTFQFADIIILALIAGFVALRLRNTLGKDVGHRPDSAQLRRQLNDELEERVTSLQAVKEKIESEIEGKPSEEDQALEGLSESTREGVEAIKQQDAQFRVKEFLEGAKGAFEWVVKAFNDGDKSTLKSLLAKEVYEEFESAMIDRESSDAKADTTLVSIDKTELLDAKITKGKAQMTVRFMSDQIHVVRDAAGKVISGNPSDITRVEDEWVFERKLKSNDPNWMVVDT